MTGPPWRRVLAWAVPSERPAVGRRPAGSPGAGRCLARGAHPGVPVAVLWADEIAHASARALSAALGAAPERAQQRRELDRKWLELARPSRPVPSAHEYPEDVRDLAGTLVARLCPECEAQLPADFEVLKGGTSDAGPRPRRGGPGGARAPGRQRRDGRSTAPGRTFNFVPGAGLGWPVVLRDADGYPFAVGSIDGQVIIQVAATAPRGTVRLSAEHVSGLALKLIEAAARVMRADPAALLMFEGGRRYELRATLAYDRKSLTKSASCSPGALSTWTWSSPASCWTRVSSAPPPSGHPGLACRRRPLDRVHRVVTPAGDARFEARPPRFKKPGEPRPGQGAGRGAPPEHPTGAAAPRDAARTRSAVPAPTAEAAVTADHPEGRARIGPGGPACSAP